MGKRFTVALAFLVALAFSAACGVHQTEAPPLSGPSELAMSIVPTAIPDSISQDGASQSSITVFVRDSNARPMPGLANRLDLMNLKAAVMDARRKVEFTANQLQAVMNLVAALAAPLVLRPLRARHQAALAAEGSGPPGRQQLA